MLIHRGNGLPTDPATVGQLVYSVYERCILYSPDGVNWARLDKAIPNCVICGELPFAHKDFPHPYCKSNLDMLEWKYEQKQAV